MGNKGRFVKGQSGNPTGRPKVPVDVKEALAAASPKAVQTLIELLDDKTPAVRLRAAIEVLNRHLGPPAAPIAAPAVEDARRRLVIDDVDAA